MAPPLVLLGSGYTLTRLALSQAREGRTVIAATRDAARRSELERAGARVCLLEEALERMEGSYAVHSVPPEAGLDTRIAEAVTRLSRVHVDDLVEALRVVLERGGPGGIYCVADDRAATQGETVAWLCSRLGVPLPPTVPLASVHETLRGDRAVRNSRLKALGWVPQYPDFPAGFAAVLEAEGSPQPAR